MSTEFEIEVARSLGRIEQKVDSLAGPDGRVTALENDRTRNWWFTIAIAPTLTLAHAVIRKLGINL